MRTPITLAVLICLASTPATAGGKRLECGRGYKETWRSSAAIVCEGYPPLGYRNTRPSETVVVADMPDVPELRDDRGDHIDLAFWYSWKVEPVRGMAIPHSEEGRWVGYAPATKRRTTLCQGDLERMLELAGLEKLPPLPGRLRVAKVEPLEPGFRRRSIQLKQPYTYESWKAYRKSSRQGCSPTPTYEEQTESDPAGLGAKVKAWWLGQ